MAENRWYVLTCSVLRYVRRRTSQFNFFIVYSVESCVSTLLVLKEYVSGSRDHCLGMQPARLDIFIQLEVHGH